MRSRVPRCFSSTLHPNEGHRETKPAVTESLAGCSGRPQCPPESQHVLVAEVPHGKCSTIPRFSEPCRIHFEAQRRPVVTEPRTHCGSDSVSFPLVRVA